MIRRLSVVVTALGFLAIAELASAHGGNSDPNVVHACINNATKVVRIVGVSGSCNTAPPPAVETAAHWAIQGPQGAPGTNGTNGTNGVDGTNATRADPPCFDNTNRYVDCLNGTVTDTVTGLIWTKNLLCIPNFTDWASANQAAAALKDGDCGLTDGSSPGDWRLPTKAEWAATTARAVALGCLDRYLTNNAGTGCYGNGSGSSFFGVASNGFYWSSSTNENEPLYAHIGHVPGGGSGLKTLADLHFAWAVRSR